jgi:hypothetical protein
MKNIMYLVWLGNKATLSNIGRMLFRSKSHFSRSSL